MITKYPVVVEEAMQMTFSSLNERQRRLYAAVEALKLGHGGVSYVSRVLGCDRKTIRRGLQELDQPCPFPPNQARKKGADAAVA